MRGFRFFLAALGVASLFFHVRAEEGAALPFAPNPKWAVYIHDDLTLEDAKALRDTPATLASRAGPVVESRSVEIKPYVDLNTVTGRKAPPESRAILATTFTAERDGTVVIGAGADWWFTCFVNGTQVYSTVASGNVAFPIAAENHAFAAPARQGENLLVLYVESGAASWGVACGPTDAAPAVRSASAGRAFALRPEFDFTAAVDALPPVPAGRKNTSNGDSPPGPALAYGPWLLSPNPGAMTVGFVTDSPVPAGVDYRKRGAEAWTRQWAFLGGQVRGDRRVHRVDLAGLEEGAAYEYRIVLMRPQDMELLPQPEVYAFTSVGARPEPFTVFFTSDLQFRPTVRVGILRMFLANPRVRNAAGFVTLGDAADAFDDFAATHVDSLLDPLTAMTGHAMPYIPVRGNHEYRGRESSDWFAYFRDAYGGHRMGDVYFLVLDTGEDQPPQPGTSHFSARTLDADAYMARQRAWLETVVETEAFRTAKYRVILGHAPPYGWQGVYMQRAIRALVDDLFAGVTPKHRIHLWLGGHVHAYRRVGPGSNRILSTAPAVPARRAAASYPFPIVMGDGPRHGGLEVSGLLLDVDDAGLSVEAIDLEGVVFDRFRIDADGTLTEGGHADTLRFYDAEELPME